MDTKISVNMTGTEYIAFQKSHRLNWHLRPGTKRALPFFIMAGVGLLGLALVATSSPSVPLFGSWYANYAVIAGLSWDGIFRMAFVYVLPWVVAALGLAWVLHGPGFWVIKG